MKSLKQVDSQRKGRIIGPIKRQGQFHCVKKAEGQSTWEQGSQNAALPGGKAKHFHFPNEVKQSG